MNTFVKAITDHSNQTTTENGMPALHSSTNANVDLFFKIGASRGKDILSDFNIAFNENKELATRIALWARDIRGGAGERQIFRDILTWLEFNDINILLRVIPLIPVVGRWDDLLIFSTTRAKNAAFSEVYKAILNKNALCAKWMPRKGEVAIQLRNFLKMSPKQYRKTLVTLSSTVEQNMCSGTWNTINYSHVPSRAAKIYKSTFRLHDQERYDEYLQNLVSGTAKVNAAAIFPHEIVSEFLHLEPALQEKVLLEQQWKALPNYLGNDSIFPMVDVSGSMLAGSPQAIDVAIGLGLYISEKNRGPFKDCILTFSESPKILKLSGDLHNKVEILRTAEWGMNTDLTSAFMTLLQMAINNHVPEVDMPKTILVLSDMQFDASRNDLTDYAYEMIRKQYTNFGYTCPNIIFWNLYDRGGNIPVKFDQSGVAMVSGFSPSIMKSILSGSKFTPESIMLNTVGISKYDF
jgi:hypothetical protein